MNIASAVIYTFLIINVLVVYDLLNDVSLCFDIYHLCSVTNLLLLPLDDSNISYI